MTKAKTNVSEAERKRAIKQARDEYGSDDIQVDSDAIVIDNEEGGTWVQSWVYLEG